MIAACLLPLAAVAQDKPNFTITGKLGTLDAPAKVYLEYFDGAGGGHVDSAVLDHGAFKFSGVVHGIAASRISVAHKPLGKDYAVYAGHDVIYPYFGAENITITSPSDSLLIAVIGGSKVHDEEKAYEDVIGGSIMEVNAKANAEYMAAQAQGITDTMYFKKLTENYYANLKVRAAKQVKYAKEHPHSYFGLVGLSEGSNFDKTTNQADVLKIYNALDEKYRNTDLGKELLMRINSVGLTAVGQDAPSFTQNDVNGKPLSLASLKGKVVLIDFWASWCSPCRAENPNLKSQYALYKDKGFEILSVSLDDTKSKWTAAIAQDGVSWLQVSDLKGWNNEVGRLYGVRAVPAMFLVGKDGKIIAVNLRGETLNTKLAELFKES